MFDVYSYNKGGVVLYMLCNYVGDVVFFVVFNFYLIDNVYMVVEVYNLWLAFEEVMGEDFNWFFNQWYFEQGYLELFVSYDFNEVIGQVNVIVEQI